jgi:hypothetical protein
MASLIHCYNVVIAAPRRLLDALPRPRRHWRPGKRSVHHAAAGEAKTILVCTVTGGLGYGGYRAFAGNAPAPALASLNAGGSGLGSGSSDISSLGLSSGSDTRIFLPDIGSLQTISETQIIPPGGDTIPPQPIPEPSSALLLGIFLLALGIVQWRMR